VFLRTQKYGFFGQIILLTYIYHNGGKISRNVRKLLNKKLLIKKSKRKHNKVQIQRNLTKTG